MSAYDSYTKDELVEEAEARDLPISGTKSDLIARLDADDATPSDADVDTEASAYRHMFRVSPAAPAPGSKLDIANRAETERQAILAGLRPTGPAQRLEDDELEGEGARLVYECPVVANVATGEELYEPGDGPYPDEE